MPGSLFLHAPLRAHRRRLRGLHGGAPLRHQRRIYLFIASLLGNPADIEDVCQQTCLALWKRRNQLPEVRDFFAWACGFARNEALHQIRSNSRSRQVYMPHDLLATHAEEFERDLAVDDNRLHALTRCLGRLQTGHRDLLKRCYQGIDTGGLPWLPQPASDETAAPAVPVAKRPTITIHWDTLRRQTFPDGDDPCRRGRG